MKRYWHWCARCVDIYGRRYWYRLSPKLENAVNQHNRLKRQCKEKPDGDKSLTGRFVNAPLTPYFSHNRAGIGVVRIIYLKVKKAPADLLCTRSQFIDKYRLKNLISSYQYLRHDYGKYSRWQIFTDLYLWRRKLYN